MKKCLALCSLLLIASSNYACLSRLYVESTLGAVITDASTSEPIAFASCALFHKGELIHHAMSDFDGHVSIDSLPYGFYTIEIQSLGYASVTIDSVFLGLEPVTMLATSLTALHWMIGFECFALEVIDYEPEAGPESDSEQDSILAEEVGVAALKESLTAPVSVYPNPAKDEVYIRGAASVDHWLVFDLLGNVVLQSAAGTTALNVSSLVSGAYVFQWQSGGVVASQTVVKL